MSKKIFINNLNTFVSRTLLEELRGGNKGEDGEEADGDAPLIFGSYIDKDSSAKPDGVKKMLKVSYDNRLKFETYILRLTEIQASPGHEVLVRVRLDRVRPARR